MITLKHTPLWRRVFRRAGRMLFDYAENNGVGDIRRNGEQWFAREILRTHENRGGTEPFVLIDAGANAGDYTAMLIELAARRGRSIDVHAFEPSLVARERLQARFKSRASVKIVGKAVGEQAGKAVLYGAAEGSTLGSLLDRSVHRQEAAKNVEVEVTTLAAYMAGQRVGRVDLLKLDVEGYELAALRGLGDALNPKCVAAIQFEYGGTAMDAGVTLRQLYQLLAARGYVVAKLLPAGLAVRDYAEWMECYAYANYVAIAPEESAG